MKKTIKVIVMIFLLLKYQPFLWFYWYKRDNLNGDLKHYLKHFNFFSNSIFAVVYLLQKIPEFRNLFYFRYPFSSFLRKFYGGVCELYFFLDSKSVGKGLIIWHGYSTSINAISIGENCEIWQNVTIGKKSTLKIPDKPIIGNNVKICANSVVIGPIKIGNNVTIGAGTVVTKNVPDNCIVVGNPSRIIEKKSI